MKEVSDDEEVTQVKVLMALADDVLSVGKNRARIGKWIDITMRKVNILLSMDKDADWKITLSTLTLILGYNHEMVPKSKDWVERHNLDSKLSNFNTGRILVPKIQAVNECLKPTEASNDPESSKPSKLESLTLLPRLKNLHRASPSSEVMSLTYQTHSPKGEKPGFSIMKHTKPETQKSSNKNVSGPVIVNDTEPFTPSVPTKEVHPKIVLLQADKSLDLYVSNYPVYSSVFHLQRLLVVGDRESSHWQYKFPLPVEGVPIARRIEIPLPGVCTAMIKKLPVKDR
nr:hypothetical protein [Tanacetum cinerariifolium]